MGRKIAHTKIELIISSTNYELILFFSYVSIFIINFKNEKIRKHKIFGPATHRNTCGDPPRKHQNIPVPILK